MRMSQSSVTRRWLTLCCLFALVVSASPSLAGPIPSKTAPEQTLASRAADLALIGEALAEPALGAALARHGFSENQVHARLAQLSPEELHSLAGQIDQLQAAGLQPPRYIWILLAIFLGVLILGAL